MNAKRGVDELDQELRPPALVTFSRSWHALAAIRSLHDHGVEVYAGDEIRFTPGSMSRSSRDSFVYPNPVADPAGFLHAIEAQVHEIVGGPPEPDQRPVLLPIQLETYVVAEHRERLEQSVRLATGEHHLLEKVRDKGWLVERAHELGLETPRTWQPRNAAQLRDLLPEFPEPCIVKIRSGVGGAGLEKVERRSEVAEVVQALVDEFDLESDQWPIIQELSEGEDYCVASFYDHGREVTTLTYRNVGKVLDSAPGAIRETVAAPPVEEATRRLLDGLGWQGVAQVDFLWDGEREPLLIEVNPRFFGGLFQTIRSGADLPWMYYQSALGREVAPPDQILTGVRTETPVLGLLASARMLADQHGELEALQGAWEQARAQWNRGEVRTGLEAMWAGLRSAFSEKPDSASLEGYLRENDSNVSQLLFHEDPTASLGLLYPLAILLRHGKIDTELLMGLPPNERASEKS